jgi:hypothetical protein
LLPLNFPIIGGRIAPASDSEKANLSVLSIDEFALPTGCLKFGESLFDRPLLSDVAAEKADPVWSEVFRQTS